jgi:uncharacterized protein YpmS
MRRHDRIVRKYPFVHEIKVDTIRDTIRVNVPEIHLDTILDFRTDTITLEKERLKVKIIRLPGDSIFVSGKCDSIFVEKILEREIPVTIYKEKAFNWRWIWILLMNILIISLIRYIFKRYNVRSRIELYKSDIIESIKRLKDGF